MSNNRYAIYRAIIRYKRENDGCSPSIRWLMSELGISSTSVVKYHLDRLERDGLIRMPKWQTRSIQVVGGSWGKTDDDTETSGESQ